ncbi:MAG: DUF3795 domain-containing protein [Anaerolineae bacterium]|nr:DUF3795 domain-containing protein [Anaerolineae bacterium]
MVRSLIAYCGLDCAACPAYLATQSGDLDRMAAVAAEWNSEAYEVTVADVPCDGCAQGEGRVFKWCVDCPIRACCIARGYANCAYCDDLPCEHLAQAPPGTTERLIEMQRALRA